MKKYSYLHSSILVLLVTLISCCNNEDPCPTCFDSFVTCKVNGKDWRSNCISNDPLFGCRAIDCHYYIYDGFGLDLKAGNSNDNSGLNLNQFSRWGGGQLGNNSIQQREFGFNNFNINGNCIFLDSLDFSYNNYFILDKIDTINYILEGKFGYRVYNLCGDTAVITDGYFKTKFIF